MLRYRCKEHNIIAKGSTCPVCGERGELSSDIYWCDTCQIPLYEKTCACCHQKGTRLTTDIRPVFPEERLLLEIIKGTPFAYVKDSVWNCAGNSYVVNGKRVPFSVKELKEIDAQKIRLEYEALKDQNTDQYFKEYIARFVEANTGRQNAIVEEATRYIRETAKEYYDEERKTYDLREMFVSFSGGKDSTVTSDLVMRALSDAKILHIFGDTTLEFPETYSYVERFKKEHPKTPVLSSRNKEKDFEQLCELVGPPSRVMRWCCTIFKTGAITEKIRRSFRNKSKVLAFYGIRRRESASRNKYERETEGSKITKQITISPIIDWMDFDIWLYLLSTGIDFNNAYRYGYARVGCWCCPNNSVWSEFLSKIYMPEQSAHFREILIRFAKQVGKPDPEVYVEEGKWKARQGGNGVDYAGRSIIAFEPCALEENAFNYELQRPITKELYELFRPFGYLNFDLGNARLGEVYVMRKSGQLVLKLQGRIGSKDLKITILDHKIDGAQNIKAAEEKVKCQLTKYQMCMGCGACRSICKHDAIKLHQKEDNSVEYQIADDRCVRCCECVNHYIAGCYMRKVLATKKDRQEDIG